MTLNHYIIHYTDSRCPAQYFQVHLFNRTIQEATNIFYSHPIFKDCVIIKTEKV